MSVRLRKLTALLLAAWLLFVGNGFGGAFASETQHDLEWAHSDAPGKTAQDGCGHGCIGHLSAHILAIEQAAAVSSYGGPGGSPVVHPDARAPRWHSDPFSPPPDSLA